MTLARSHRLAIESINLSVQDDCPSVCRNVEVCYIHSVSIERFRAALARLRQVEKLAGRRVIQLMVRKARITTAMFDDNAPQRGPRDGIGMAA